MTELKKSGLSVTEEKKIGSICSQYQRALRKHERLEKSGAGAEVKHLCYVMQFPWFCFPIVLCTVVVTMALIASNNHLSSNSKSTYWLEYLCRPHLRTLSASLCLVSSKVKIVVYRPIWYHWLLLDLLPLIKLNEFDVILLCLWYDNSVYPTDTVQLCGLTLKEHPHGWILFSGINTVAIPRPDAG